MVDDYSQTEPTKDLKFGDTIKVDADLTKTKIFPKTIDAERVARYEHFGRLFEGKHYEAFNIKIADADFNKTYSALRYVAVNFAGMISKIVADMLFGEPIKIMVPEGDQKWIEGLWRDNRMDVQCYESALANSYKGDALFKLRIGQRQPKDKESALIIEDTNANIYFPTLNDFNVKDAPIEEILAWRFKIADAYYMRQEIHTAGQIENKIWKMKGDRLEHEVGLDIIEGNLPATEQTKVDFSLITHIPNWKTGDRYFGISDYFDLEPLFYAINNRMTKVDNVLDKHTDPILMVPPGVLDENGKVDKNKLGIYEVQEGENGKIEYVVWDASLENAFKEIEKLVEFMYMVGEVSPDVLGLGQGVSDSGRALKFKLMRTIAKVSRKKLYYDLALKQMLFNAQVFAKAHGIKVDGKTLQGEPVMPEIEWSDGLPIDLHEQLEDEVVAVDAGLKSKKQAIMSLYNMDEDSAQEMIDEKRKETEIDMPAMNPLADKGFGKPGEKPEEKNVDNTDK